MTPHQFLLLKVLQSKQINDSGSNVDMVEHFMKQEGAADDLRGQLKNLCAYVTPQLANEVEAVCAYLDMTKREFIEQALIAFLNKAKHIMDQQRLTEEEN